MPYLTHDEYKEFGFTELDDTEFNKLVKRAGDAVDSVTRHFYKINDLDGDMAFCRDQFKKAVGCQIEYFHETKAVTTEGMNSSPQTFSAGRTSVSNASRYSRGGAEEKKSLISDDVFMHLYGTGLLYAGVATW